MMIKKLFNVEQYSKKVFSLLYGRHRYQTATKQQLKRLLVQKESTKKNQFLLVPPTLRLTAVQRNFSFTYAPMLATRGLQLQFVESSFVEKGTLDRLLVTKALGESMALDWKDYD
jgi:hypothetical protein